jgi:hypothetical protein
LGPLERLLPKGTPAEKFVNFASSHWLAAVFDLLTYREVISAPVMVNAIRNLLGRATFMPAPAEFCTSCFAARHDVSQLRDEIVRLAALPPPSLPELPPPKPDSDEGFRGTSDDDTAAGAARGCERMRTVDDQTQMA